jgi:secreted Zn-dependent insulinase-like peptidase
MGACASLNFSCDLAPDNIDFRWNGYNDSMKQYVSAILEKVGQMRSDDVEEQFNQNKEKKLQEWNNHYLRQTVDRCMLELSTKITDAFEMK